MKKITLRGNWQTQIRAIARETSKNVFCNCVEIAKDLYEELTVLTETMFIKNIEDEYNVKTVLTETNNGKYILFISPDENNKITFEDILDTIK